MSKNIRPISICIFYHNGKILATEGYDKITKQKFYRSIGGGINPQESSQDALIREVREELDTEVENFKMLGVFENIFVYDGNPKHEIVFVYDGQFKDKKFYDMEKIVVQEGLQKDNAVWLELDNLPKDRPVYPNGVIKLIKKLNANE